MSIIADTPQSIRFFSLLSIRGRLSIEVNTGMRVSNRVSTLAAAKRNFGVVSNTKKGALAEVEAMVAGAFAAKKGETAVPLYSSVLAAAYRRGMEL